MSETKGQVTKNHILREGLMLASIKGLVNISIGGLAAKAEMSRSGLFAHFLSKEQLQLEILNYANDLFHEVVINPCKRIASPTNQVEFLKEIMPSWYEKTEPSIPGGCIFLTATLEFDDRPGKVKELLLSQQTSLLDFLKSVYKNGVDCGEFKRSMADEDFAFVFYSFYMGINQYKKFFGDDNAKMHGERHLSGLIDYIKRAEYGSPGTFPKEEN